MTLPVCETVSNDNWLPHKAIYALCLDVVLCQHVSHWIKFCAFHRKRIADKENKKSLIDETTAPKARVLKVRES
jgi:hypothetical protein